MFLLLKVLRTLFIIVKNLNYKIKHITMSVAKIYLLDSGKIGQDLAWFLPDPITAEEMKTKGSKPKSWIEVPVAPVVIEHKDGIILFDTGISETFKDTLPKDVLDLFPVTFSEENRLESQLKKIGLKPEDIHFIVLSHLHWDHVGNLELFKSSKPVVMVHEKELKYALFYVWLGKSSPYFLRYLEILRGMNILPVTTDYLQILPDVELYLLGGHTPGSMALKIRTQKDNNYIFTGDFVHIPEQLESEKGSWLVGNYEEFYTGIRLLKAMMMLPRTNVILEHDPKLWDKYPKAPKELE